MLFGGLVPRGGSILGLLLQCHLAVGEVCGPATPRFLCRISDSTDLCLALAHSPWFDIWTGQNIFILGRARDLHLCSYNQLFALFHYFLNF